MLGKKKSTVFDESQDKATKQLIKNQSQISKNQAVLIKIMITILMRKRRFGAG